MTSNPLAADIEVDGAFVGNTPSTVDLAPGDHTVALVKSGYKRWERKVKVTGGNVNINAELSRAEVRTRLMSDFESAGLRKLRTKLGLRACFETSAVSSHAVSAAESLRAL